MGDIEFLSIKEFEGKLRYDEGTNAGSTGTLATLDASSGKDMYIARAKVSFYTDTDLENGINIVELQKDNGAGGFDTVETSHYQGWIEVSTAFGQMAYSYEFKNIGWKVAATETIRLQITQADTHVTTEGFIECFEEDTGESPQVPSI